MKKNIDLIEHEIRFVENNRENAINRLQWSLNFSIAFLALIFIVISKFLPKINLIEKLFMLNSLSLIFISIIIGLITLPRYFFQINLTQFKNESEIYNKLDHTIEREITERRYKNFLNMKKIMIENEGKVIYAIIYQILGVIYVSIVLFFIYLF